MSFGYQARPGGIKTPPPHPAAPETGAGSVALRGPLGPGIMTMAELLEKGKFRYLPLETEGGGRGESPIVQQPDGTVRIRDSAFTRERSGQGDFQNLVDQVTKDHLAAEKNSLGIDDLFGDFGMDLHHFLSETEETGGAGESGLPAFGSCLTEDGFFQYDNFLTTFRKSDSGIVKSLMSISRILSSYFCAIMIPRDGRLKITHSIGLKEAETATFGVPLTPALRIPLEAAGKAVFFDWPIRSIHEFSRLLSNVETSVTFSLLLLPLYFRGDKGYLAMGVNKCPSAEELKTRLVGLGRAK